MKTKLLTLLTALALASGLEQAVAQGTAFTYEGRLDLDNTPATGLYDFQFRVYDTEVLGIQQGPLVSLAGVRVTNGLFTARLDFGSVVFTGPARWLDLRVQTNGLGSYTQLTPRTELTATPYAIYAAGANAAGLSGTIPLASVADGTITGVKMANGTITAAKLAPGTVASAIGNDVNIGTNGVCGRLDVYSTDLGMPGVTIDGCLSELSAFTQANGLEAAELAAKSWGGYLRIWDERGVRTLEAGTASAGGGHVALYNNRTNLGALLDADNGGAGLLALYTADGAVTVEIDADSGGGASSLLLKNSNDVNTVVLDADNLGGGYLRLRDGNNGNRAAITTTPFGVTQSLYNSNGVVVISLDTSSDAAGRVAVRNQTGSDRIILDGADVNRGGRLDVRDATGTMTVQILGAETAGTGSRLQMFRGNGLKTVELKSEEGTNNGSQLTLANSRGTNTIVMDAQEGTDIAAVGDITMYRRDGIRKAIQIDADYDNSGFSRIITDVLEITGGSDLSENFDIKPIHDELKAGMIVSIDPQNPGQLVVSGKAYDRTVAGVMSGAGGVKPGMLMGQRGTKADGKHPVALTGRVYCWVDADAGGSIEPGDLITTSMTPGHGMKVGDHNRSQGAIIGKAMTGLNRGKGLVLVLVSLQ